MNFDFISDNIKSFGFENFELLYSATDICSFTDNSNSIIVVSENEHLTTQFKLSQQVVPETLGGYKYYFIANTVLNSPWFETCNRLESIFNFRNDDYKIAFSMVKSFIEGVLAICEQQEHFAIINYDSFDAVKIVCYTHKTNGLTDEDYKLSKSIFELFKEIKSI